jgi:hypothetical protein
VHPSRGLESRLNGRISPRPAREAFIFQTQKEANVDPLSSSPELFLYHFFT